VLGTSERTSGKEPRGRLREKKKYECKKKKTKARGPNSFQKKQKHSKLGNSKNRGKMTGHKGEERETPTVKQTSRETEWKNSFESKLDRNPISSRVHEG